MVEADLLKQLSRGEDSRQQFKRNAYLAPAVGRKTLEQQPRSKKTVKSTQKKTDQKHERQT